MAKQEYKRERKKFTDGLRLKRLKDQNDNFDPEEFSGCLTLGLRTMVDIQNCRLEVNHTFPDKEILVLRVAEEANLRGINFVCTRSDLRDFKCTGPRFCVIARHTERQGWFVSVANICECDEFGGDVVDVDDMPEKLTSPFRSKWIVPLILSIIINSPAMSNKDLRHALSAYGKEPALETAQGMKRKPKYLTRFCQICRGFSHRTIDCWLQEKNKQHRPQAWKGQLAQEMNEALEEAEVEVARRISADPLPVGAGDWQGWCDGNEDEEGTAD